MPYVCHRTIRFGDVDPAGIVYYPRVLDFVHRSMESFFADELGVDYAALVGERRLGCAAVKVEVEFRRPLRFGDRVAIAVSVERVGTSSVAWRHRITNAGSDAPRVEARVVTVLIDMDSVERRELPEELRAQLSARVEDRSDLR